jgi:hypothetical protein
MLAHGPPTRRAVLVFSSEFTAPAHLGATGDGDSTSPSPYRYRYISALDDTQPLGERSRTVAVQNSSPDAAPSEGTGLSRPSQR